ELNTGVTLPLDAELKVGNIEETITVTGASPVVDVQNVRSQNVLTRTILDTIPTAKTLQGYATLTLGAVSRTGTQDVGGNKGEQTSDITIHNSRATDGRLLLDGMNFGTSFAAGGFGNKAVNINQAAIQEITLATGGASADSETSGATLNMVP